MNTAAIYIIKERAQFGPHVGLALVALRAAVDQLILVAHHSLTEAEIAQLSAPDRLIIGAHNTLSRSYGAGINALTGDPAQLILTGAHAYGSIVPIRKLLSQADQCAQGGLFAAYGTRDMRAITEIPIGHEALIPSLDFAIVGKKLRLSAGFQGLWTKGEKFEGPPPHRIEQRLVKLAERRSLPIAYAAKMTGFSGAAPAWFEPKRMIQAGAPCIPAGVFGLDPLLHDLCAVNLRGALQEIGIRAPDLLKAINAHTAKTLPPRIRNTLTDSFAVLPVQSPLEPRAQSRAPIAVFIHAYYPEMMPELYDLAAQIPGAYDLFISTASSKSKAKIEAYLKQVGAQNAEVRIVAQNRGRDMSSLFITFADIALSGRYEIALRLHSKRTPQVQAQVGESFRAHLFENTAASPGYIREILARFDADPMLGLIMPPCVNIGFGALGHGWYGNRAPLEKRAQEVGIDVPLDSHTPLAPYGTMFWFRPEALAVMFSHPWRWSDYNAEPNHIDGGLAHVQERLIGYAVQSAGYSILQVMTPENAARNYARLEYKFQLFAGQLASASVIDQYAQLRQMHRPAKVHLYAKLAAAYAQLTGRFPALRPFLRPVARKLTALLLAR
ncbi:MAG: rhamnan synthesis F family protein [Paracoccaceae bacterium]